MNVDQTYQSIISDLTQGKRALLKLKASQIEAIIENWELGVDTLTLKKILCILDHSVDFSLKFESLIISEIKNNPDDEILIFLLGAAQKHIIAAAAKDGFPPSSQFMSTLKDLLQSSYPDKPEVFEWLLRTIEQTGIKSIFFKKEILKRKPGITAHFNQHKKACKEIIELLERRWAPLAGGPLG